MCGLFEPRGSATTAFPVAEAGMSHRTLCPALLCLGPPQDLLDGQCNPHVASAVDRWPFMAFEPLAQQLPTLAGLLCP